MSAVVIFLGPNNEYLGCKAFEYSFKAELFIEKLEPLMLANIEKKMTLRDRLILAPEYFPFAGRLQDVELITLTTEKGEKT
jgi:hypothetical protein